MQAEKEDLPHIYLWNPQADRTMPYPDKMNIEDMDKYSPETILAWLYVGKLETDLGALDDLIHEMQEHLEAEKEGKT